jgi:hypothetical protein
MKAIAKCHNATVGHFGMDRTCAMLKQSQAHTGKSCWQDDKEMKADVGYYISSCSTCQRLSQVKRTVYDEAFSISSSAPMEKCSIDTLGPFPPDKDGNIYIIVIIDCFSRYVCLYPAADCTADSAAHAIVHFFGHFGVPKILHSDNGSQYANQVINELSKVVDMSLEKTIAYSHEENGIVERVNKETLRHVRAILFDKEIKPTYNILLPLVQRIINATVHSSTGFAPASIMMPALQLNAGIVFPHYERDDMATTSEYVKTLQSKQAMIIRKVQATLGKQFATNKAKFNAKHPDPMYFPDGSYVLLRYPVGTRPPTKTSSPWMGPYQVLSHKGPEYQIVNLLTGKPQTRHISRLKAYDDTRSSPLSVATAGTDFDLVESIVSHTAKTSQKSKMRFRTRWIGYGPDDDSHQSWSSLKNNSVFHQYCREQNLTTLIPDAFADTLTSLE